MTDCYAIKIRRVVLKQLARIPTIHRKRIEIAIDQLSQTPYPHGCKKLVGEDALWRIRIGDYRVIYLVAETIMVIEIHAVGHRQSIYTH